MIQFPCNNCKYPFSVDDDQAGGMVQCPACGLLNDVPSLNDLGNLADDGTFRILGPAADEPPPQDPGRLDELFYVFQKRRTDAAGNEIDLRQPFHGPAGGDGDSVDPDETPQGPIDLIPSSQEALRDAPRYDPETGELVRPLDLMPDALHDTPADQIPLAKPAIGYARGAHTDRVRTGTILLELFQPGNVVVMAFVLLAHIVGAVLHIFILLPASVVGAPAWPFNVAFWLVVAHYGNTIQDIGPEQMDELPRPLRGMLLYDDILSPLFKVMAAVLLCFAPALAVTGADGGAHWLGLPLFLLGSALLPAVLLTTVASGSIANLRPGSLLRIMRRGGKTYLLAAIVWALTFPVYVWAALGVDLVGRMFGVGLSDLPRAGRAYVIAPVALSCVYFMHYFCWLMGMLYRLGHADFGWVWQELERDRGQRDRSKPRMTPQEAAAMHEANRAATLARRSARRQPGPRLGL